MYRDIIRQVAIFHLTNVLF